MGVSVLELEAALPRRGRRVLLDGNLLTLEAYDSPLGTAILLGGAAVCLASYRLMLRIGRLPQDVRMLQ